MALDFHARLNGDDTTKTGASQGRGDRREKASRQLQAGTPLRAAPSPARGPHAWGLAHPLRGSRALHLVPGARCRVFPLPARDRARPNTNPRRGARHAHSGPPPAALCSTVLTLSALPRRRRVSGGVPGGCGAQIPPREQQQDAALGEGAWRTVPGRRDPGRSAGRRQQRAVATAWRAQRRRGCCERGRPACTTVTQASCP